MVIAGQRRRGQVWWARVDKRRPVLLLSRAPAYIANRRVLVAPITSRLRYNDATVELGPADGLPRRSVVNLENLASIPQSDLEEYMTTLHSTRMQQVCDAVRFATGCD